MMKRNQTGFTLIEIAIVLVIIGLLLGGVLKGQELINSAKVKNLASDFKNVPVYVYGYQDKYKSLPGDDSTIYAASTSPHVTGGTECTPALANRCARGTGIIDGNWNASAVTDESYIFWQQVRLAGLAPGSTDTTATEYRPTNAVGGYIGITNSGAGLPILTMSGTYIVCSDGIAGKFAKQLDTTLDDGNTFTGSLRVTDTGTSTGGTAKATNAIVDDTTYLVCMGF